MVRRLILSFVVLSLLQGPVRSIYAKKLGLGAYVGIALVQVPDWWIDIQSPVTTSLNLRLGFWNNFGLEGGFMHIWNTQSWWRLNPNIWTVSIEGNNKHQLNPRFGIDYSTGAKSRYGWNCGIHFSPSATKKLSYNILALIRFEDMYSSSGFEISSEPRGIYISLGISYLIDCR